MNKSITFSASDTFKLLYVIAIFMVIDGHIGSYDYLDFNGFFKYQNYHISLFMFTSGYFFNLNRSYKEFFVRKFSHLIIPLYVWNLLYGVLCYVLNNYFDFQIGENLSFYNLLYAPIIDGHQFIFNMASWFLVPLFFVQLISFLCLKPLNYKYKDLIFFVSTLILSCLLLPYANKNNGEASLLLLMFRCVYFLPIFSFGFIFKNYIEKYDFKINSVVYFLLIFSILTAIYINFPNYNHTPSWLNDIHVNPIVIYVVCFLSILFWTRIAKIFTPILSASKCLKTISNNTFNLMMHHFVGFTIVKSLISNFNEFDWYRYKTDIWYYFFPYSEFYFAWIYIAITIVIAILIGFTFKKICDTIKFILIKIRYQ